MTKSEFLKLPIEERRAILKAQCTPEIIHHYGSADGWLAPASAGSDGSAMRLKIAELEAARSEALLLLESLLPITWSEDWDADDVRRKLEWAIRFCGGHSVSSQKPDQISPARLHQ